MWFWPRHKPDGHHVQLQFNSRQFFRWIFRAFRDWGMTTWLHTTASGCVFMGAEPPLFTISQDLLWHTKLALLPLSLSLPPSDCCSYIYPAAHWFQVCQQLRAQPISGHLILSLQGSGSLVTNCSCTSGLTEADRLRVSSDKTLTRLCSL